MTEDDLVMSNDKANEILEAENKFHAERKMFYFDDKTGDIRFPTYEYENISHDEWFECIKVDIEKVIRGYFKDGKVYCYIGKDFRVPTLNINQYMQITYIFNCNAVYLGVIPGEIGTGWKPIYEINIYKVAYYI